jgi:hypothetical protein
VRDVGKFIAYQKQVGATTPRVSLWLTGLKETVVQLPEFVRLAAQMGVMEVHLQRLVFDEIGYGKATAGNSPFESTQEAERQAIEAAQEMARISPPMDALSPAASRRSPSAVTATTRSATRHSRISGKYGIVPLIGTFGPASCPMRRRRRARIVGCDGASNPRHSDLQRCGDDRRRDPRDSGGLSP